MNTRFYLVFSMGDCNNPMFIRSHLVFPMGERNNPMYIRFKLVFSTFETVKHQGVKDVILH